MWLNPAEPRAPCGFDHMEMVQACLLWLRCAEAHGGGGTSNFREVPLASHTLLIHVSVRALRCAAHGHCVLDLKKVTMDIESKAP